MKCLYIIVFFNIVAGIVQTFIKSWKQLLYPRATKVYHQPFEPRHDFFLHLIIVVKLFPSEMFLWVNKQVEIAGAEVRTVRRIVQYIPFHLLRWEIVWRKAPRNWRDFGSVLPFQTRLTQTKPALPLSNKHGSHVKDQGRRQCCHNKHKKFPCRPTRDASLLSGHASYLAWFQASAVM